MAHPDLLPRAAVPAEPGVDVVLEGRARPGGARVDVPGALASCLTMLTDAVLECRAGAADGGVSAPGAGDATDTLDTHPTSIGQIPTTDPGAPPLSGPKVAAEAAMLLGAAARTGIRTPAITDAIGVLAGALAPLRDRASAVRLCLHPAVALDLALVHLHLRRVGYPDPQWDLLLRDMLDADRLTGPERLPHREMEQGWLLDMWSGTVGGRTACPVPSACALARPLDALNCTIEDLYELTHSALYASDLGHAAVELPRPVPDIVADAEVGLAIALDGRNHDIATELLWLWPLLHLPWTPAAGFAWNEILRAYLTFGFLPGPGFDAARYHSLHPEAAAGYVRRSSYHTAVAFGILLCAMASTDRRRGDSTDLTGPCEPCDRPPDALAITSRLRRDRAAHDLPALRHTLALAVELGVAGGPAPRQAAALLHRAALVLA